jgi:putative inorganic carbon (hco3(-)) transporter
MLTGARVRIERPALAGAVLMALAVAVVAAALLPMRSALIGVAALLALGACIAALARPAMGLALALIAGPLQPLERIELRLPIDSGQGLLALALFAFVVHGLAGRNSRERFQVRIGAPLWALAGFLLASLLTVVSAWDITNWLTECLKLAQMLVIALIVAHLRTMPDRAIVIGALLLSALGEAGYGVVQNRLCWSSDLGARLSALCGAVPPEFRVAGTPYYRGYGTFEQPNPFGGYMGMLWPFAAGLAGLLWVRWRERREAALLLAALLTTGVSALCVLGLFASGSRGGLIGLGFALVAMLGARLKRPLLAALAVGVVALAAVAFGVVDAPASLEAQLAEYGDIDVRDTYLTPINFSTVERIAHWQAALAMIRAHPWLGVGLGGYETAYATYRNLVWVNALGHAHNMYLNVFAETGALGLSAYVLWWGATLVATWRQARRPWRERGGAALFALGLLGAWAHVSGHHIFDNLYVANMHMTIGVLLGLLSALSAVVAQPVGARRDAVASPEQLVKVPQA